MSNCQVAVELRTLGIFSTEDLAECTDEVQAALIDSFIPASVIEFITKLSCDVTASASESVPTCPSSHSCWNDHALDANCIARSMLATINDKVDRSNETSCDAGPAKMIKRLSFSDQSEQSAYLHDAKIKAIIGSCPRSLQSMISGTKCYLAFALAVGRIRDAFPLSNDLIVAWSNSFRCHGTFKNYVGYARTANLIFGFEDSKLDHSLIRRAAISVLKRRQWTPRPRLFVDSTKVSLMLAAVGNQTEQTFAMLFLFSYCFLLRLPSEALPVIVRDVPCMFKSEQAVVVVATDSITLHLRRRKNKPAGSILTRSCCCSSSSRSPTCPVHVLGKWFDKQPRVEPVFASITGAKANIVLRSFLKDACQVVDPRHYKSHDLRRGHADDLRRSGASLIEILRAGEWRSPAFLSYLNEVELERDSVVQAHVDESSSEEEN
jgi:hypothetical protein